VKAVALYGELAGIGWLAGPQMTRAHEAPLLDPAMMKAVGLIFMELATVTAIAVFFSTFSTPILSAALTFGLFAAGRFSADLRNFDQVVESPVAVALARGLYWILPNLAQFDVRAQVVHGVPVPAGYLAVTCAYAVVYIALLLTGATVIFSRRDFK
jgi:hypothetical protein